MHAYSLFLGKLSSLNESILLLSSHGRGEEAHILARSLLETVLYLSLIIKFPSDVLAKYIFFSANNDVYRKITKDEVKKRYKNNLYYLSSLERQEPMKIAFENVIEEYKNIRSNLFPGITFNDRSFPILGLNHRQIASLVNLENLYDDIYWQLCIISHPNLSGLSARIDICNNRCDISLGKTHKEVTSALFFTLEINLAFLKQFYTKQSILDRYQKRRDSFERDLLLQMGLK